MPRYLFTVLVFFSFGMGLLQAQIEIKLDFSAAPREISPLIYGANEWCNGPEIPHTASRWGGNRLTAYNWETNASNAGSDYIHHSDNYLVQDLSQSEQAIPGIGLIKFQQKFKARNQYTLGTIQLAGYVAADKNGTVAEGQTAPSSRWVPVKFKKETGLSETPNLNDGAVYMDEFVYAMKQKLGDAENGGVYAWSLDNEPALWPYTHVRIHPGVLNVKALLDKSIAASRAVKDVDANAEIYGPATYGWGAMMSLNGGDWDTDYSKNYDWFISAYLDGMKKAGEAAGKRLLDVLDFHWYPEASGECRIIIDNCNQLSSSQIEARLQAPRALWDPTYVEKSWIQDVLVEKPIVLLKNVQESINRFYPGTKMAITEYEYGAHDHYSGGLAQADVLGVFGRENVYMATLWSDPGSHSKSAFNIYLNYDGAGGKFGKWSIPAMPGNLDKISAFAAFSGSVLQEELHLMLINKSANTEPISLNLAGASNVQLKHWYWFGEASNGNIQKENSQGLNAQNQLSLKAHSVNHIILSGTFQVGTSIYSEKQKRLNPESFSAFFSKGRIMLNPSSSHAFEGEYSYEIKNIRGQIILSGTTRIPSAINLESPDKGLKILTLRKNGVQIEQNKLIQVF